MATPRATDALQPDSKGANLAFSLLAGGLVLGGLYLTRLYSYLLFHSLVEFFSIVVAFSIFTVFWNSRRFSPNGFFLFLGIAYLYVGLIDLLHTLAYDGMGVFPEYGKNLPTQLWIAGRWLEALSWLAAPWFFGRRTNAAVVMAGYAVVVALLLISIFAWPVFPACFVEGVGLTRFKKASELVIALTLLAAWLLLRSRRRQFDTHVYRLLAASLGITMVSSLSFTLYNDVYGTINLVGHFFKLISFFVIYKAFVEVGLSKPYALLFLDLKRNQAELQSLNETLEQRVRERTAEAQQRAGQLRALALQLTQVEQRERRRLAQVLHDHLQQLLYASKLSVGRLRRHLPEEELQAPLDQVDQLLQESIAASRSLTMELSPPVLYNTGLAPALEWLARSTHEKHGLTVQVEAEANLGLVADDIAAILFQAVRELLFNVVKHAHAESAVIQLRVCEPDRVMVVVADSGAGFDPKKKPAGSTSTGGFGLFSLHERLELLGGAMEIESSPGKGTRVTLVAPRQPAAESLQAPSPQSTP